MKTTTTVFKKTNYKGIRKNLQSGNYQANKSFDGKRFVKTFEYLEQARRWVKTFNPSPLSREKHSTFNELWEVYIETKKSSISIGSLESKMSAVTVIKNRIGSLRLVEITTSKLSSILIELKEEAISHKSKRLSFNKPLKEVKAAFNWFIERNDTLLINPVKKCLLEESKIRTKESKRKYLTEVEVASFISSISNEYYRDFAIVQYYLGARVSEIAGLQVKNIDIANNKLVVKETVSWSKGKNFLELRSLPKNGQIKEVDIATSKLRDILTKYISQSQNGYLFHLNGNPLKYRSIQHHYSRAKKKAGLQEIAGSTHFLRHTAATIARSSVSLDAAQAMTGHQSIEQLQVYAQLDTRLQASAQVALDRLLVDNLKNFEAKEYEVSDCK